jgi:hypothetical protein
MAQATCTTTKRFTLVSNLFLASALILASLAAAPSAHAAPTDANGYHSVLAMAQSQSEAARSAAAVPDELDGLLNQALTGARASGIKPLSTVGWECTGEGWIQSAYNGLYVSTEVDYSGAEKGMLRARSTSVGPWELYQICWRDGGGGSTDAIWSDGAAKFVTAEIGPEAVVYGMLRARANSVGAWEEFTILGGPKMLINAANGLWVSAEFGWSGNWYGMLRARAESIGEWEEYDSSF